MSYKELANEFLKATFELNKKGPQKRVDESMKGERFVLYYLYFVDKEALPSEIGEKMGITNARITAILNKLEVKKLIERSINPNDRRQILVELTEKGIQIASDEHEKVIKMVSNMLQLIGEEDSTEFVRLIKKIVSVSDQIELPDMSDF